MKPLCYWKLSRNETILLLKAEQKWNHPVIDSQAEMKPPCYRQLSRSETTNRQLSRNETTMLPPAKAGMKSQCYRQLSRNETTLLPTAKQKSNHPVTNSQADIKQACYRCWESGCTALISSISSMIWLSCSPHAQDWLSLHTALLNSHTTLWTTPHPVSQQPHHISC